MMATAPASKHSLFRGRLTAAQYLSLPDDGNRYELFEGELVMSPSPFFAHGRVVGFVFGKLDAFVSKKSLGLAGIETDVVMSKFATVLRPDVCFVAKRNLSHIRGHLHGPPNLAIEVTSPGNWQNDIHFKRVQYERFGVEEYWVLHIADGMRQAYQWYLNRGRYVGGLVEESYINSRVLPGFKLRLRDIWKSTGETSAS